MTAVVTAGTPATGNSSTGLTVSVPTHATDDLLLLCAAITVPANADNATPTLVQASWNLVDTISLARSLTVLGTRISMFKRIAASEPADYVVTSSIANAAAGMTGIILRVQDHNDVDVSNRFFNTGSSSTCQTPAVDTTEDDELVIRVAHVADAAVRSFSGVNTEIFDFSTDPGSASSLAGAWEVKPAVGNTGAATFTVSGAAVTRKVSLTAAIRPQPVRNRVRIPRGAVQRSSVS